MEDINSYKQLKWGILAYFFLLIFEGALRKWVLPGLSAPLLIVRDPLAIWLIYLAWSKQIFPFNNYVTGMSALTIFAVGTTLIFGHGNIPVALYGARILLVHFPFMFVIGHVFTKKDVLKLGKIVLALSLPMTILIILQFYSPQNAWVNRGVGGDLEGAGFSGALGYFRPSGTFSFTTGTTQFFALLACFIIYFWLKIESVNRLLLFISTLSLLVAIPFSISRTLLFSVIISLFFALVAIIGNSKYSSRIILAGGSFFILVLALSRLEFFQIGLEVFTARFENASVVEGGLKGTLVDRYLGGLVDSFYINSDLPFFGYGLGMGTNVGSQLLTGGRTFLIAEEEWGRLIGEMGLLLGIGVIGLRVSFFLNLVSLSYKQVKSEIYLPWMLLSFGAILIPNGQWAQPTTLGFSTLAGGIILASLHSSKN